MSILLVERFVLASVDLVSTEPQCVFMKITEINGIFLPARLIQQTAGENNCFCSLIEILPPIVVFICTLI